MLMVKEEIRNTVRLTRIRFRVAKRSLFICLAIYLFMMITSTIQNIIYMFQYMDTPWLSLMEDFSALYLLGTLAGFLIMQLNYCLNNGYFEVYPQTNNSRFISSQLLSYGYTGLCTLVVAVGSLLRFGLLKILALFHPNFVFAYDSDIGFFVTGFFVYFMYGLLIGAMVSFIGVLIRKFKIYTVIALAVPGCMMISNFKAFIEYVPKLFGFLMWEKSIGWFFVKGMSLFICLTVLSLIINFFTVYYRTTMLTKNSMKVTVTIAGGIVVGTMIFGWVTGFFYSVQGTYDSPLVDEEYPPIRTRDLQTLEIDISHLEKNAQIMLRTNENIKLVESGYIEREEYKMYIHNSKELQANGTKLIIYYEFPFDSPNGVNTLNFINPDFQAKLEGNELFLSFLYSKNVKVIALPMWEMAGVFDRFNDKNLVRAHTYSSGSDASLQIVVE